jgi:hypothetical protein
VLCLIYNQYFVGLDGIVSSSFFPPNFVEAKQWQSIPRQIFNLTGDTFGQELLKQ